MHGCSPVSVHIYKEGGVWRGSSVFGHLCQARSQEESAQQGTGLAADAGSVCGPVHLREARVARTGTRVVSLEQ